MDNYFYENIYEIYERALKKGNFSTCLDAIKLLVRTSESKEQQLDEIVLYINKICDESDLQTLLKKLI